MVGSPPGCGLSRARPAGSTTRRGEQLMAKKRVCMVGAGRVGRLHTRSITERLGHRAEVVALVDPSRQVAEELAADYEVPQVYASLQEALDDGSYDGVVITTPTFTHRDLAVLALDAGLPVHLEK